MRPYLHGLGITLLVVLGLFAITIYSPPAKAAAPTCNNNGCVEMTNANGTYYVAFHNNYCFTEDRLRVAYQVYNPYSWTDSATGVTHWFGIVTDMNYDPPPCGPPTNCQASGAALDGSGFTINVFNCYNNVYIYDKTGKLVFHDA